MAAICSMYTDNRLPWQQRVCPPLCSIPLCEEWNVQPGIPFSSLLFSSLLFSSLLFALSFSLSLSSLVLSSLPSLPLSLTLPLPLPFSSPLSLLSLFHSISLSSPFLSLFPLE